MKSVKDERKTKAQLIEELAALRQGRRREALACLRGELWDMERPEDFGRVVSALARELDALGVAYRSCAVALPDSSGEGPPLQSYHVTDGVLSHWVGQDAEAAAAVLELSRADGPTYRRARSLAQGIVAPPGSPC